MQATPTPMLVGSRQRSTLLVWRWVPLKFWEDHTDRAPYDADSAGTCKEERRAGSRVLVYGSGDQFACLRSDAEFYAQGNVDDCTSLVRSARRTLEAIEGV